MKERKPNLPEDFIFSQSSLQDYVDCPRRFELKYLMGVRWPAPEAEPVIEHEEHLQQGALFHHLVHQHTLGIPAEIIGRQIEDEPLREWWDTYTAWDWHGIPEERQPEMMLSMPLGEWRLMAKYDLLAIEPDSKAIIIDWKTSRNLPKKESIAKRMQTVVYRYVLAHSGDSLNNDAPISPDNIHMIYWYASLQGQSITLNYDEAQVKEDETQLLALVDEINERDTFPLTDDEWKCKFCVYRSLCDRGREAGDFQDLFELENEEASSLDDFDIDLDQIAEIEF